MAVVASLSEVMDVDPTELEPLHQSIDTGALDDLLCERPTATGDRSITFGVNQHTVTVSSFGTITITPLRPTRTDDSPGGAPHE